MSQIEKTYMEFIKLCKGFPVILLVIVNNKVIKKYANLKSNNKYMTNHKIHAEYLFMMDDWIGDATNASLLISLPPCKKCHNLLKKNKWIKNIYYIVDPRKKMQKQYIKNSKIPISRFKSDILGIMKLPTLRAVFNKKHMAIRSIAK